MPWPECMITAHTVYVEGKKQKVRSAFVVVFGVSTGYITSSLVRVERFQFKLEGVQ